MNFFFSFPCSITTSNCGFVNEMFLSEIFFTEKFITKKTTAAKVVKIRFGWLDHEDWMGQKSATGQQSRLSRDVENFKLVEI